MATKRKRKHAKLATKPAKRKRAKPVAKSKPKPPKPKPKPRPRLAKPESRGKRKRKPHRARARKPKHDKRKPKRKLVVKQSKPRKPRAPKLPPSLRSILVESLHTMNDYARAVAPCELAIEDAPPDAPALWLLIGHFEFKGGISWLEIANILEAWEADDFLAVQINPDRLSQIQTEFEPENGKRRWASMTTAGPWGVIVSEAFARVDPDDEDSWAQKYTEAEARSLDVFFSESVAIGQEITL